MKKNKAFSLLEMIFTLSLIGLFISIIFPTLKITNHTSNIMSNQLKRENDIQSSIIITEQFINSLPTTTKIFNSNYSLDNIDNLKYFDNITNSTIGNTLFLEIPYFSKKKLITQYYFIQFFNNDLYIYQYYYDFSHLKFNYKYLLLDNISGNFHQKKLGILFEIISNNKIYYGFQKL